MGLVRKDVGWRGLLEERNLWTALVPIGIMFGTSLLNLVVLGPATTKIMRERKHQGKLLPPRVLYNPSRDSLIVLDRNERRQTILRTRSKVC